MQEKNGKIELEAIETETLSHEEWQIEAARLEMEEARDNLTDAEKTYFQVQQIYGREA